MEENKVVILKKLEDLLNCTRVANGIIEFSYKTYMGEETIFIYENGKMLGTVCVTSDSGVAMIRDILQHPYFN